MKPPKFDPEKKYPLLVYVYGEPAGQTAVDHWAGKNYLWHLMLAQQGYLVMNFDNRGTPAPRGRAWRNIVHRRVGILAPQDQYRTAMAVAPVSNRGRRRFSCGSLVIDTPASRPVLARNCTSRKAGLE